MSVFSPVSQDPDSLVQTPIITEFTPLCSISAAASHCHMTISLALCSACLLVLSLYFLVCLHHDSNKPLAFAHCEIGPHAASSVCDR